MRRVKQFADVVIRKPLTPATASNDIPIITTDLQRRILEDVKAGRVYTIKEVQNLLRISYEKARQLCTKEPGILRAGDIRVPHCVFDNIVSRLMQSSAAA
jgi:hypothetical protein